MVEENRDRIYTVLRNDLNKTEYEAELYEVTNVLNEIAIAINNINHWTRPERVPGDMSTAFAKLTVRPEPMGTVLIIGAWNFPFCLTIVPLVSAIAAGCTAVVKPSEVSLNTCRLLKELIPRYLDKSAFPTIFADGQETANLLKQHRFDLVFFTGSSTVGRLVYQAAAAQLTPVVLELGGKNPVYLDRKFDLTLAAKRILWARTVNSGQLCLSPEYVLLPKDIVDNFVAALRKVSNDFFGARPELSTSYSGKIINKFHFERIRTLLQNTNGEIVIGGKFDAEKLFFEPTVVKNVTVKDSLMAEEIFGPILLLVECENESEAIEFINNRDTPLAAYCFTKNKSVEMRFIEEVRCGGMSTNECFFHAANYDLPFGGKGCSGMGSYHGYHGFRAFSHHKSVFQQRNPEFIMQMARPPYSKTKLDLVKMLMRQRPRPRWMPKMKVPAAVDWILTFALYGVIIALIAKVATSDHLVFRWPWEWD